MPLFTALGTALGATAAASAGAGIGAFGAGVAAAGLGAAAIGSTAYSVSQASKKPSIPELPKSPTSTDAMATAKTKLKKSMAGVARNESIYTSPLGVGGQADVNRKTLLGQ